MKIIVYLVSGIVFVLAGIFKWYKVLCFFALKIRPINEITGWIYRGVSILFGVALIILSTLKIFKM